MRFGTGLALAAGCLAFLFSASPAANAQEKKEPQEVKISYTESGKLERTGWSSEKAGLLVATNASSYNTCWQLLGQSNPLVDPVPFNERYIYIFVLGGHTDHKPGNKVEVTGISRRTQELQGPRPRVVDWITVEAKISEPSDRKIPDDPRSPVAILRIERKNLDPAVTQATRFMLHNSATGTSLTSIDASYYAPGGRWLVSYKAGEGEKAIEAIKQIGLRLIENYERGNFLVVAVDKETKITEIDRLHRRSSSITRATPNLRIQALTKDSDK